jgi:Spy/CpxP family protein refolding chaperone
MNKLIIAIASTLIMTVAGASFAQDDVTEPEMKKQRQHRQHQQQRQQRGMQSMPVVEMTMRAIRQLDLDDAQKEGIRSVMEGLKENVRPIMMKSKTNLAQLPDLVKAASYPNDKVAALAEKEGALAAKRLILTSQALSDVYNILTIDQRTELDAMAEQRREKRSEKRQPKDDGEG